MIHDYRMNGEIKRWKLIHGKSVDLKDNAQGTKWVQPKTQQPELEFGYY